MILSIESSCDDSSIAITQIEDCKLVFHKKISQELEHSQYGGVVPELAARLHAKALPDILEQTKEFLPKLKAVAVTNEPGLSVTLVEGVSMAQALGLSLDIPLIPINHLMGHIYSLFIDKKEAEFPLGVLLVSGGHTQVLHVRAYDEVEMLASTLDDSFGESFDKVAKMLGLGYPGGPVVEEYAKKGDAKRFDFTLPMQRTNKLAFSYSGLKNQVRLACEELGELSLQDKYDICASFQKVAIAHLVHKLKKIFPNEGFKDFAIVGGASANLSLRTEIENLCKKYDAKLLLAPMEFCSDNAAMIGRCSVEAYKKQQFVEIEEIKVNPRIKY